METLLSDQHDSRVSVEYNPNEIHEDAANQRSSEGRYTKYFDVEEEYAGLDEERADQEWREYLANKPLPQLPKSAASSFGQRFMALFSGSKNNNNMRKNLTLDDDEDDAPYHSKDRLPDYKDLFPQRIFYRRQDSEATTCLLSGMSF